MEEGYNDSLCKVCDDVVDEEQLLAELEHLRRHLAERDTHIVTLEAKYQNSTARVKNLDEQLATWKEKYERLYDSHKRVQKLNQVLEDKLLQMVDKMKSEKSQLTKDIATLSVRLAESKHNYSMLQKENERYKNDMNLAIQLLQCKPDNFVSHKLDNLPIDTQARVSQYVMSKTAKPSASSQLKLNGDNETFDASEYEFNISASLMSKILEDSIQDTVTKHCDTCTCAKSHAKPFCYNESYYSVSTQTLVTGETKSFMCSNCHIDMTSLNSNLSIRSITPPALPPVGKEYIQKIPTIGHTYIIPQPIRSDLNLPHHEVDDDNGTNSSMINYSNIHPDMKVDSLIKNENIKLNKHLNGAVLEPAIHHKLCDHPRASISSKKSSTHSTNQEESLLKDASKVIDKAKNENHFSDNVSIRKNSLGSMGGVSRTSSVAKSTVSTHKSNGNVGPGPRFCHLRMQPGSKNILLDNAEPDVPPVIYKRQSKCNENTIFKDLNDGITDFLDLEKQVQDAKEDEKNEYIIESTLIEVDTNNKETTVPEKSINPVLLNVSSSPLQPLKTHNFSQNAEQNNNVTISTSQQNHADIDNLLNDFVADNNNAIKTKEDLQTDSVTTPDNDIKIFNFDRYEQNKMSSQYPRSMKKIDMSQLHTLENTKISKDLPPHDFPDAEKKETTPKANLPSIINVYPNLTQTQLKVNENKKVFTNEQSTSSLSSDDSAALLQKQQLLRVAEWVEKNLEQQNNFNDPLEEDVPYNRSLHRNSKLFRATETVNELVLNMPHPVSKFSKSYPREPNIFVHNSVTSQANLDKPVQTKTNVIKETIFPVDYGEAVTEVSVEKPKPEVKDSEIIVEKRPNIQVNNADKDITPEELARMEYNVKKFLLSGPYWVNPETHGRGRRTTSKTETDV